MRPQCCNCCDEGERIFTYLLNHLKLKHYEDYNRHTPDAIIQICNCPEALRLKLQFVNHILYQKIIRDKHGDQEVAMSCEIFVKAEESSSDEQPQQIAGQSAGTANGVDGCDTRAIVQRLSSLEDNLLGEMHRMQANLRQQMVESSVDLEALGFPLSRVHHVQTVADFLREKRKFCETFELCMAVFIKSLPINLNNHEICDAIINKLFTEDLKILASKSKSHPNSIRVDEIIFETTAEITSKVLSRDTKEDFVAILMKYTNAERKKQSRKIDQQLHELVSKKSKMSHIYDFNQLLAYSETERDESIEGSSSSSLV